MSPTSPTPFRIAIVGAGVIGKEHEKIIGKLGSEAELVSVVDVDLEKAQSLAKRTGAKAFASLSEALAGSDVDIVSVCVPTGSHGEVAIEALRAAKHVIVEKPAEVTLAKTDAIIAEQAESGKLVTVISQHRFDRATEILIEAIGNGELGRITSGIASIDWWRSQEYYDSGDWRGTWTLDGGGALMNQGVHTVDLLVAALGTPVEVFAYTACLAHERIEVEDVAVGVVKFASGALGVLHGSTAAYPGLSARLQIHGSQGSAIVDNDELTYIHTRANADRTPDGSGNQTGHYKIPVVSGTTAGSDPRQHSSAHLREFQNFLAAIRGEEEIRVGLAENRKSISIITGVYESARTGKAVSLLQD